MCAFECTCISLYACEYLCLRMCWCVFVCVCVCMCVGVAVCVSTHYEIKSCCKRNSGKILNVPANISPIRVRSAAGELAGRVARISGWDTICNRKCNFLIILHLNFEKLQNFK
jgi:hypothetical protein